MLLNDYIERINRYRRPILGFCILEVIFLHADFAFFNGPLSYAFNLLWEVDIFFFLSGLGLYYSFTRDEALLPFYRRRLHRVYSRYWPVLLVYELSVFTVFIRYGILPGNTFPFLRQLLGNVFLVGWYVNLNNQFNWYIQSLMAFYLFAPPLILLIRQAQGSRKKCGFLLGFCVVSQICFFGSGLLIAYSRLIAFVLGILAADFAVRKETLRLNVPVMLILFVIGNGLCYWGNAFPIELSMAYGLCWYPSLLVLPGALYLLPLVFALCEKHRPLRWISEGFAVLGNYSLEAYLVNVLVYDIIVRWGIPVRSNLQWLLIALALCPLSVLYGRLLDKLSARKRA